MNGWFGENWGAPVCQEIRHRDTPVGTTCMDCGQPIGAGDQGIIMPSWDGQVLSAAVTHLDCLTAQFTATCPHEDAKLAGRPACPP